MPINFENFKLANKLEYPKWVSDNKNTELKIVKTFKERKK